MLKSNVIELEPTTSTDASTPIVVYKDGFLKSATKQEITGEGYSIIEIPLTQGKQTALDKPDYDYTNMGYAFDKNSATEILILTAQLPHSYKEGTDVIPYLHWKQDLATPLPVWTIKWRWYNNGAQTPAWSAAVEVDTAIHDFVVTDPAGITAQVSAFPALTGTGKTISSIIEIQLYRKATNITEEEDVIATSLSLHYYADSLGSSAQFTKS
jgi:hypothetical protein